MVNLMPKLMHVNFTCLHVTILHISISKGTNSWLFSHITHFYTWAQTVNFRVTTMLGGYTEDITNNRTVKIAEWALAQGWPLAQDNTVLAISTSMTSLPSSPSWMPPEFRTTGTTLLKATCVKPPTKRHISARPHARLALLITLTGSSHFASESSK